MADSDDKPSPFPRRFVRAFVARPRLLGALAAGLAVFLALTLLHESRWVTRAIISWDVVCVVFILFLLPFMWGTRTDTMRRNAASQDEGQGVILGLAVIAGIVSIAAVAAELAVAKDAKGAEQIARVVLAVFTVAASWAFIAFVFCLHYAHEYYGKSDDPTEAQQGGLCFPGDEDPDYWDFLHFSIIIGVANQTADVQFTSKELRRTGSVHGVLAFLFNTGVLALTINMVAGLFA